MTEIPLIERAQAHGSASALTVGDRSWTYHDLLDASARAGLRLLGEAPDLAEARVAFLVPAGFEYVAVQWGIWRAGGMAVPLSVSAKEPELEHVLTDAEVAAAVVPTPLPSRLEGLARSHGIRLLGVGDLLEPGGGSGEWGTLPAVPPTRRAMMLYTSGTTSKPKGVVSTHANVEAQIRALVEAWGWRADDRIPLFLPLHHIHGIVNILSCALWSGAQVEMFDSFEMDRILARVADRAYSVFMAVPTIYAKLIRAFDQARPDQAERWAEGFRSMRLMVSGSAALPAAIHQRWTALTGQQLLERYGMTEIGMGLSNPLHGERRPGAVGRPLPGVEVRLVTESGDLARGEGEPGEIHVRGPGVFREYWKRPQVTAEAFVDGWFRTGDMAVLEEGYYRILGRLSVDIIKSGGYKISALEIEDVLRSHPRVREVAVVGIPDEVWGETVAAAVIPEGEEPVTLPDLQAWSGERLSDYKVPRKLAVVADLPRNAMGKVTKPAVRQLFMDG